MKIQKHKVLNNNLYVIYNNQLDNIQVQNKKIKIKHVIKLLIKMMKIKVNKFSIQINKRYQIKKLNVIYKMIHKIIYMKINLQVKKKLKIKI